jgi:hypothetical protein
VSTNERAKVMSKIDNAVCQVVREMSSPGSVAKSIVKYVDPKTVVKITRKHKKDCREVSVTYLLTIGKPNYAERKFVKLCVKAGERFPVSKMQYKFYPKAKK